MKLLLERFHNGKTCTLGRLSANGVYQCYTIEDIVREVENTPVASWKVYGETAIPRGVYELGYTLSPRMKRFTPELQNVPGYTGIRIHVANWATELLGCIAPGVGLQADNEGVTQSTKAYNALIAKLNPAFQSGEHVTIEVG